MRLSIIIPTLNEEIALPETLRNVARRAPGCEVIVADGGSTDGTRSVVETFTECPVLWIDALRGRGAQMNIGAARATGDVFLFLHADTLLPAETPQAVIESLFQARPESPGGFFRIAFQPRTPLTDLYAWCYNLRSRLLGVCYGDAGLFFRREAFESLGGYRPALLMEDYDLVMRARRTGRLAYAANKTVLSSSRRFPTLGSGLKMLGVWALMHLLWTCGAKQEWMQRLYPPRR